MPLPLKPTLFDRPLEAKAVVGIAEQLRLLAGYLLNDQALGFADLPSRRPPVPHEIGCCWPMIAVRRPAWRNHLLPAFFLPLQWRRGGENDRRLPPALRCCAEQVRRDLEVAAEAYSLGFAWADQPWPDLSRFTAGHIEANSCYPALALGLQSCIDGIAPNPKVWASAAWDDGPRAVDCLAEKVELAKSRGGKTFYMAPLQDTAAVPQDPRIEILSLEHSPQGKPRESLAKFFARGYATPDRSDWEACRDYHASIRELNPSLAIRFYDNVLFQHITRRCQQRMRVSPCVRPPVHPTHMVTIASGFRQPIRVIAGALNIRRVLVLYTVGAVSMEGQARDTVKELNAMSRSCVAEMKPFRYDPASDAFPVDFVRDLEEQTAIFTDGVDDSQVVFDIDRGLTLHKLALSHRLIRKRHLVATLYHEELEKKIIHGTERILLWRGGNLWDTALIDFDNDNAPPLE